jgi:dUTP pyrophosphatase
MHIRVLDEKLYAEEIEAGFMPKKKGDAAIDLRATETRRITHRETAAISLGVAIQLSGNKLGWITGRSSTALTRGLFTHEGTIDSGYRGEVHALLTAIDGDVTIQRGERIAQLIVVPIVPPCVAGKPTWKIVDELTESQRGGFGLGSTGRD